MQASRPTLPLHPLLRGVGLALCLSLSAPVLAHGQATADLADFAEHLDDYRVEVRELLATADRLLTRPPPAAADADPVQPLIDHWEAVHFHLALETRATPLYPGVWIGISELREALQPGATAADRAQARAHLAEALWQGLGALRLAAATPAMQDAPAPDHAANTQTPAQTLAQIMADLDQAVEAYADDQPAAAARLIHESYMGRFEGLEGALIARDAELVSDLEEDFNASLPRLIRDQAPVAALRAEVARMQRALTRAGELLEQTGQAPRRVF